MSRLVHLLCGRRGGPRYQEENGAVDRRLPDRDRGCRIGAGGRAKVRKRCQRRSGQPLLSRAVVNE